MTLDQLYKWPWIVTRLRKGPLAPCIDDCIKRLSEEGYVKSTIQGRITIMGAVSRWMQSKNIGVMDLDEQKLVRFMRQLKKRRPIRSNDEASLRWLLAYLRRTGLAPTPPAKIDESELSRIVRDYEKYLMQERRLSQASLDNYLPVARLFLGERFGRGPILPTDIGQKDISRFMLRQANKYSRSRAKLVASALRSFFRFMRLRGDISVDLAAAVPRVANWRFSTLPMWIPAEQVEELLCSCNQSTKKGQRNYTILLMLARLGLRSKEIVTMTLDDIDWEAGEITVGGKSRRQDRLPLPKDVGEALAWYLQHGRPQCSSRRVFIRAQAPFCGFTKSSAICSMVRRAFERAGLNPSQKGPHILRHSLATDMLRKGASLDEIGYILRHRDLNTTQIYAKVDLEALRRIARPWPGGEL